MKNVYLQTVIWIALSSACYAQDFTSNLPIVIINTISEPINDEPGVVVNFGIINNAGNVNHSTDPPNEYKGKAKVEFRGCTSQHFPKKSFGVELRDSLNTASDISDDLFGFPAEADWVLNASYTDKSFLRETLPFYMSNLAGDYASRTKYVEVMLDGVYQGIYVFQEKVKRNSGRINIKKLENVDVSLPKISGGYILKIDKNCGDEVVNWNTTYDSPGGLPGKKYGWGVDYPKADNINPQQLAYIRDYITQFEDALHGNSSCDSVNGYSKYIVEASFIDYILFQEMSSNADAYRFSTFFSKDRDGKLRAGPVWDFGLAFGFLTNPLNGYSQNYQGWRYNGEGDSTFPVPFFWERLLRCARFRQKVVDRYHQLRAGALKTEDLTAFIDTQFATLHQNGAGAYQRNFERWPILTTQIWTDVPSFVGGTLEAERDYLKNWLTNRLAWMDANIASIHPGEVIPPACDFNVTASPSTTTPLCSAAMSLAAGCTGADCSGVGYQWSGNGINLSGMSVNINAPATNGSFTYTVTASRSGCANKTATASITVANCQPAVTQVTQAFSLCLESEDSNGNGPVTGDPNASGGNTRGDKNNYDHYVDYAVNGVGSAGVYQLKLRYYASGSPLVRVSVNGSVAVASLALPSTYTWNIVWREETIPVTLAVGNNTVRIQGLPGASVRQDKVCVTGSGTTITTVTCNFAISPTADRQSYTSQQAMSFQAGCTGSDCGGVSYTWTGNSTNASGSPVNINAPASAGDYTYVLTASRTGCADKTTNLTIHVSDLPPACDFNVTASPSTGTPLCSAAMSLAAGCTGADCSGVGYQWSGNGINLSGMSVNINAPATNGSFTYTATASRSGCANKTATASITVANCQPAVTQVTQAFSLCLESEDSNGNGPVTGDPNASGGNTRGDKNNYDHYVDYAVNGVGSAGVYQLKLRYYASGSPLVRVSVNGSVAVASLALPSTYTWNIVWREETIPVTLAVGNNTVRIQGLPGASVRQDKVCVTGSGTTITTVTCNFAISPTADRQSYTSQQAMSFQAGCTGSDCGGVSYTWTGNGTNASGSPVNINAPASAGDYTYVLTASRTGCADKTTNLTIHVSDLPPACDFNVTASPSTGTPLCSAAMSLAAGCTGADCSGVGYQWSGNGINLSGMSVNINAPATNGPFTYTVTASRSGCANKTATASITVANCQPAVTQVTQAFSLCLESEDSNGNGPVTGDPNASGGNTRGDKNNYDHYVDYAVNGVGSAGVYQLKLRYYASGSPLVRVSVNGSVAVASLALPSTYTWNIVWREETIPVTLAVGNNTVRVQGLPGASTRQDKVCVTGGASGNARLAVAENQAGDCSIIQALNVFPNPAVSAFAVSFSHTRTGESILTVMDMQGKVWFDQKIKGHGNHQEKIRLHQAPSGIYFLQIRQGDRAAIKKVLITN